MIPKYIFDIKQSTLNNDISVENKLYTYRKLLYSTLLNDLKVVIKLKSNKIKIKIINEYKIKINEIDNILKNKKFTILK